MKKLIIATLAAAFSFTACKKENTDVCRCMEVDPTIASEWHLIETLEDPGDGSGTFQSVTSNKNVIFYKDSTVVSNGNLCHMNPNTHDSTAGQYTPSHLIINGCGNTSEPNKITYEIDGNTLILTYFCIEPCKEKYARIMY